MKEAFGDLFDFAADATVITTNGFVKKNGEAVMGRGCAAQARRRWPRMPALLGHAIRTEGNHVIDLGQWDGMRIVAMPVKHNWWEPADLALITKSALELSTLASLRNWNTVVMPRPGCGNGQLHWNDVQPVIAKLLDDRFTAVTFEAHP